MNINDVYLSVFDSSQLGVYCHRAGHRLFLNGNRFIWLFQISNVSQLWTKINVGTFENSPARLTEIPLPPKYRHVHVRTFILSFFHLLVHNTEFSSTVKQFNEKHPLSIIKRYSGLNLQGNRKMTSNIVLIHRASFFICSGWHPKCLKEILANVI